MNRREFLKALSASGILLGTGLSWTSRSASAANVTLPAGFPSSIPKILINITLDGGPDFRHLLPPQYLADTATYGYQYWKVRANAHAIAQQEAAYEARWNNDFLKPAQKAAPAGNEFGILNSAKWLFDQWEAGNLAVVNNALGSNSRDHAHGLLVMEQGDRNAGAHDLDKPGWGGRLAKAMQDKARLVDANAQVKIVSLTHEIRRFSYGPHPTDSRKHVNDQVISVRNSRNLGLFEPDAAASITGSQAVMSRALKAYYAAKRDEMNVTSPYYKFVRHERDMRAFGDAIKARLIGADEDNPLMPVPDAIRALYDVQFAEEKGLFSLNQNDFGLQIRNLYDCLACQDILNFRIASMAYRGWDTHKNQKRYIEQRFEDLFHEKGAIATLFNQLPDAITDNLIIVLSGEFGRQLKANGDNGTDHGRGNSILVIGKGIKGGLYGDMFPAAELERVATGRSVDITGKTGIEHVFAAVCEAVEPSTSNAVFPEKANAPLEEGVDGNLFV